MTTLSKQLRRLLWAQHAVCLAAGLGSTLAYVLWLGPARATLRELRAQTAAAELRTAGQNPAASPDLAALTDRLDKSPRLADSREGEVLLRDLVQACEQAGLRRITARSGQARESGAISELPLALKFQGNFLDACAFLRQIQSLPWPIRTRSLFIRTIDPKAGDVEVRLSVKAISWEG